MMSDFICKKTMSRCMTPSMCSPYGGCTTPQFEYDELYSEYEELLEKVKTLSIYFKRYEWLREHHKNIIGGKTATVVFWLDEPYEPDSPEKLDRMIDNFLEVKK